MIEERRQAYHETIRASFKSILKDGALVPLGIRADDESIRWVCEEDIADHRYKDARAGDTIRDLVELFLRRRPAYDKKISYRPKDRHSGCLEIIFSYGTGILLNGGGFILSWALEDKGYPGVYGFVYDSEWLVKNGGRVITEAFDNEMRVRMQDAPPSTIDELIRLAEASQEASELSGAAALDFVREHGAGYYIFWPGLLSLDMASEIWENGKIIKRHVLSSD